MSDIDIHQIQRILPHRYPFLLIDRVLECRPREALVAIKNVTINEAFFQGHFPHRPVMPGVLILEAMAQATGLLAFHSMGSNSNEDTMYYLVGVDKARFKRPVEPGDQLVIEVSLLREIRSIWKFSASAKVGGRLVSSAELMTTQQDIKN